MSKACPAAMSWADKGTNETPAEASAVAVQARQSPHAQEINGLWPCGTNWSHRKQWVYHSSAQMKAVIIWHFLYYR